MTRDVGRYVEGCDLCQRMKNRMEELAGKLKLSDYEVTGGNRERCYFGGM